METSPALQSPTITKHEADAVVHAVEGLRRWLGRLGIKTQYDPISSCWQVLSVPQDLDPTIRFIASDVLKTMARARHHYETASRSDPMEDHGHGNNRVTGP